MLVPRGCMTDDGRRIDLYQTYDTNQNYRMQCILDPSGNPMFTYKSCIYGGLERTANEQWDDGKYWYTCVQEGDYLRVIVSGCIDEGRRVNIDDKVTKGSFVYQCKRSSTNGTCSMCPVACTRNGREYPIGEDFEDGDFWYSCTKEGNVPISSKVMGCVNNGDRVRDGDRYVKNDVVYQCAIRVEGSQLRPVACLQKDDSGNAIERRIGDSWVEGQSPFQYDMSCKFEPSSNSAVKVYNRCTYKGSALEAGCYELIDNQAVACEKDTSGRLNLRSYRIDDIGQLTGLRFC